MEHLPIPDEAKHFIKVPYFVANPESDWYNSEDGHNEYPVRMGWSQENLMGHIPWDVPDEDGAPFGRREDGNPRDTADIEKFFQTWLFFGTAIEFLKAGGVNVTTEDFLEPKGVAPARMVTTAKLPSLLMKWNKSTRNKESLWKETKDILNRTVYYLNLFCQEPKEKHPSDHREVFTWPVRDLISTSIIALVFTLRTAALHKCDKPLEGFSSELLARSAILYKRLEKKWCIADATRMEDDLEIDGHYFLALSPGLDDDELDNHIWCTRDRCHYLKDDNMYVTKHAPEPWHQVGCERAKWGGQFGGTLRSQKKGKAKDWVDSVVKILNICAIPIALWSVPGNCFYTVEHHPQENSKLKPAYIAISHVYGDGKGNPLENSLPVCQIKYIQHMVDQVRYEGRKPPVAAPNSDGTGFWMDTMCVPVSAGKEARKKAIAGMKSVYENAKCTLILDELIMQIPSTKPTPTILTRLYQSNWIKRLWTHQEGFFPKELFVQFSDRALKMDLMTDKRVEYESAMLAKGIPLKFPTATTFRLSDQYRGIKQLFLNTAGDKKADKKYIYMLYGPLAHNMRVRQTSRQADETVCLATILDIDTIPYQNIPDKPDAEAAKERMEMFLKKINKFQMGLIFNNWERMEIRGFSWAPKSLLGHRGGPGGQHDTELGVWDGRYSEINWGGDGTVDGLPVQYPGFSSFEFSEEARFSIRYAERAFAIQSERDNSGIRGPLYVVEAFPNKVIWEPKRFAVILSKIPEGEENGVLAIIGVAATGYDEVTDFGHLCLARVRVFKEDSPDWLDVVPATILSKETKWLVG